MVIQVGSRHRRRMAKIASRSSPSCDFGQSCTYFVTRCTNIPSLTLLPSFPASCLSSRGSSIRTLCTLPCRAPEAFHAFLALSPAVTRSLIFLATVSQVSRFWNFLDFRIFRFDLCRSYGISCPPSIISLVVWVHFSLDVK